MKPLLFNALVWLNRPTVRTVIVGLALLLVTTYASAVQLIVIHDPSCKYCVEFQNEVVPTYGQSEHAEWIYMNIVTYSRGFQPIPDEWPAWFRDALHDGRIGPISPTPAFIFYETPMGEPMPREIGRFIGYGGEEWFYLQMDHYRTAYEEWILTN